MTLADAGFVGVTPEVGIVVVGIGVDRDGQHVVALEEDALRAVAVMDIDIEHGHALMLCRRRWAAMAVLFRKQKPPAMSA